MVGISRDYLRYSVVVLFAVLTFILLLPWWQALLTVSGFIPHGHCYLWKPGLVWLHVTSDALIGLSYVAISATLAYLVQKTRQEIPFHWMFLAFGSFIIACGSTHFVEVWTLWHPTYWFSGTLKIITAIASVTTAIILPTLIPKALALVEAAKLSEERRSHLEAANRKLETLNEQLKELDHLKTQFFANINHELRTPLALILGPTEKLLQAEGLNPEQRNDLAVVDRNARLLLKQVNDLLDVSKLDVGKMGLNTEAVDLTQLVRLTASNFDALAQEKQITFVTDTPESLPVQIDAVKVQRVLLNLLSNAFKFTPEGGMIRCVLATQKQEVAENTLVPESLTGDRIVLSVCDSGAGVPLELREAIFERFRQGEGGLTRRFGGTGLGLAIAKEFVELQGGMIQVGDAPEGGAQFTVELPFNSPTSAITTTSAWLNQGELDASLFTDKFRTIDQTSRPQPESMSGKPLVLIVEDNPEMNQFLTHTLSSEYRVATASNGEEGLGQAIALQPDLILSDVMMPYLSGAQLVQQLRSHPALGTVPIVMLTAKTDDELRVQLLRQGAQDYLMKPFSVEELRARVGNLMAIKRVRDLLQQELASQSHDLEGLVEEVSLRRRELQIALDTLQRQAQELEQANRLKDEFLAIVSHELRTPLNAILGWAEALRQRTFSPTVTERALETIERNARLQSQLIENLLDVSRLLRGKLQLNQHPVQLQSVIEAALQRLQPEAIAKSIRLDTCVSQSIDPVLGDADRLRQVVENLLSNAIKFTPAGGQVAIRLEQQQTEVCLQVRDTGEGICHEALPYIFDYFWQSDSSNTRKHGGLGLGLTIASQLVELHHGKIRAESLGEGQGATFTVTLPVMTTSALYLR